MNLAPFIDHTILKNTTTNNDVNKICSEAMEYGFAAVCVPPCFVNNAAALVKGTGVKVATVIGFPFGYHHQQVKITEASKAIADGADELDMVINIAALKSDVWPVLEEEAKAISDLTSSNNSTLKLIIETGILSDEEIIKCCQLYQRYPIQFLKTSTGFGGEGASVHAVQLMRKHLPHHIQIKASGGIRDYAFAKQLIDAGATRLGCSAGIAIVNGEPSTESY